MAGIEYHLKFRAGTACYAMPEVNVMGKGGELLRVRCAGCSGEEIATTTTGHYVKVIASRYTNYSPYFEQAEWHVLGPDEAVLGWRTNEGPSSAGMWTVYLLTDKKGNLRIIPRHRVPKAAPKSAEGYR